MEETAATAKLSAETYTCSVALFFQTLALRELLAQEPQSPIAAAKALRSIGETITAPGVADLIEDLVKLDLVKICSKHKYGLTAKGLLSVADACPPTPENADHIHWARSIVQAIAHQYNLPVYDLYHADVGNAVYARARLCIGIHEQLGWSPSRIDEHFGLTHGWARRGIERWKRLLAPRPCRAPIGDPLLRKRIITPHGHAYTR